MKKRNSMKTGIIVAVLLLTVGFAAVTTTLIINGTINIVPDTQDFEEKVIFKTATVDPTSGTATIASDGKSITFTTHELKSIDETSTLTYTIENGSQYGAKIGDLTCTSEDTAYTTYVEVTAGNALSGTTLAKGTTSGEDTVVVKLKRSYAGAEGVETGKDVAKTISFTCTMNVDAVES